MIHKMANPSMFPEELYNLTQLADVTLAAGKLSTTNAQTIRNYMSKDNDEIAGSPSTGDATVHTSRDLKMENASMPDVITENTDGIDEKTDAANNEEHSPNLKEHFLGLNKLNKSMSEPKYSKSNFSQRQSSFSSSEDDSTYNYSHKIFDKRKSRKLWYKNDDHDSMADKKPETVETFIDKNITEIEDSSFSNSETESSNNDYPVMKRRFSESMGGSDDVHICPECGKKYSTSSNLARHRQTHRSLLDKKARRCPHCDKVYVSMPAFSMHVRTHNQGCECPHCGKRFSRPWLLQGHIRTHTGEKPFQCSICTKAFADKSNLRAHIQTHSNTKPHTCTRCGKAFALKSYLYKHEESSCMRNHSKTDKEKIKNRPTASGKSFKKIKKNSGNATAAAAYTKELSNQSNHQIDASTDSQECIYLDAGSKKSYIDLTKVSSDVDLYPRMSVIRTVVSTPTNYDGLNEFYQEKPVDFSPKNKLKNDCSTNLIDISRNYATMVV